MFFLNFRSWYKISQQTYVSATFPNYSKVLNEHFMCNSFMKFDVFYGKIMYINTFSLVFELKVQLHQQNYYPTKENVFTATLTYCYSISHHCHQCNPHQNHTANSSWYTDHCHIYTPRLNKHELIKTNKKLSSVQKQTCYIITCSVTFKNFEKHNCVIL